MVETMVSALIVEGITAKRTSAKRKVLKAFFMEQFSLVQLTAHYLTAANLNARLRPICASLLTPSKPVTCGHIPVLARVCATTKHCNFSAPAFWLQLADLCFATNAWGNCRLSLDQPSRSEGPGRHCALSWGECRGAGLSLR